MGPQPSSRGNAEVSREEDAHFGRLQWGRNLPVAEIWRLPDRRPPSPSGFNGAATFQSRKSGWMLLRPARWSRFNGAATFQSRKCQVPRLPAPVMMASMGPQPSSRGNRAMYARAFLRAVALQWGRNLPVAEISRFSASRNPRQRASMGPQPSSRGNPNRSDAGAAEQSASMGPQPSSRGNRRARLSPRRLSTRFNGAATFQSRKYGAGGADAPSVSTLQWGRNLPVAEIGRLFLGVLS